MYRVVLTLIRPCGSPEDRSIIREARRCRPIRNDLIRAIFLDAGKYEVPPINDLTLIIALFFKDTLALDKKLHVRDRYNRNFLLDID